MYKLSVIIPVYNEGEFIYRNLHECIKELNKYGSNFELIVVDDGSTDHTRKEAEMVESDKVKIVGYEINQGKGFALKYGYQFITGEVVTFMDGDLDLPPRNLQRFFPYLENADIVIGSKRHPNSKVNYPLMRKFLSLGYSVLVRILFGLGVSDTQSGMKLMKREFVDKVLPKVLVKRFAFDLELLVVGKKYGFKFAEAPIDLNMHYHNSKIGLKSIWPIFLDTMAVAYRLYWLRWYDGK
ncbi:MAG: Glycosyltransferase AglD [Candidatus Woesearchaeota archaeon]|nr:Glycosyltransferase AglD [Candidatus Woesearchaeota archaeon]